MKRERKKREEEEEEVEEEVEGELGVDEETEEEEIMFVCVCVCLSMRERFQTYTRHMPKNITRKLISDAFMVWSEHTPLSFTEVRHNKADINILFASKYHSDGYPFDGQGMVLGHAFFPGKGKGGDTHFDEDEQWRENATVGVDLFMVAAHEFGHALGLAHSGNPSALMYPWYMGFEGRFRLPEDDYRGIVNLYGTGEKNRHLPDKKVALIPDTDDPRGHNPNYDVPPEEPKPKDKDDKPPDPCKSTLDAVTVLRKEIFLFIGKWFWRMDERRKISQPVLIHQFWNGLPKTVDHIDALFEQPDGKIIMFSGNRYWMYNANYLTKDSPPEGRPITDFNIPDDVKKIDAAFVWGYNMRTYLVSGDMYWKMDERNSFVEYDYPRDMGTWKGVPVPLDAAYRDFSGKTYFFQGSRYWEFYDLRMRVRRGSKIVSWRWLNCPKEAQKVELIDEDPPYLNKMDIASKSAADVGMAAGHKASEGKAEKDRSDKDSAVQSRNISLVMLTTVLLTHVYNWLHNNMGDFNLS
ncbi:matrix metalloproteinase [Plakobranchus ocellatus]|uniref:Matrix metalloproteinase n=1 Tax=Plakobranchus ocellatus TaxID=259542 RepID=A0AAV4CMU7_9GAST|nr:matrix metalloproteinase [Plakobranchus ocellatus]